jgi:histidyl-tRNA synthetase
MRIEKDFKLLVLLTIILAVFLGLGCPTVALPLEAPQRYEDSMAPTDKPNRPKARVAKGFRDISADEIRGTRAMLATIQRVYESYGFEPIEQPFIEYTDALGKFLPDQDRPNAGVFSFQDEDEQWLSLRYDLTAPLARYVAENNQKLPTPVRSYRQGWVFRNEKPGPGRFRQFMQFDADTVGSSSPAADAEVCMMAADTMDELGLKGQYVMKVNNRKILDGCLENIGLHPEKDFQQRLIVLRAMDKLDRLGIENVKLLLGKGRKDESGDETLGANLGSEQIDQIIGLFANSVASGVRLSADDGVRNTTAPGALIEITNVDENIVQNAKPITLDANNSDTLRYMATFAGKSERFKEGLDELERMVEIFDQAGYGSNQILVDPSVVRGLEYYTGPIFECELLMPTSDEKGNPVRFGSVGGGGRYDDLVARFTGQQTPATGFSIGVSRLYAALKLVGKAEESDVLAPVVVTVMDKDRQGDYWRMVQSLRAAGIRAEMSLGAANMGKQMKYADKRGSPLVVIQGGDEKALGQVTIKDLRLGAELASGIETREEYASQRLAQVTVAEADLVKTVQEMLARK